MNISITLINRKGLTREEVNSLLESTKAEIRKMDTNVAFWKSELKKRQPITNCPICNEPIDLWPFETEAYYVKDNNAYHTACYKIGVINDR